MNFELGPLNLTFESMRILLVSTTAIGDTIMATPFIRAVHQCYPQAHITVFAHHRRMAVLEHNPNIDTLLPYYGKGKKLVRTLLDLRRGNFDLAIVIHANDPDIVPLVRWTGAPQRVGWGESKSSHLLTHTIYRTNPPEHFLLHKKRLVESIGIPVHDLHTEIFLEPADSRRYKSEIKPWIRSIHECKGFIVIHAFGTNTKKWWPLDHFFVTADHVLHRYHLASVFIGDTNSLNIVKLHPMFNPNRHFVAEGFSIRESAGAILHADRMLTTDSGPMHMAFALRIPTFCLFGPTNPAIHGPIFDHDRHFVLRREPLPALTTEEVIRDWDHWIFREST